MSDNKVANIIQKIMKKQTKRNQQLGSIYVEEIPQNSRITNYELQDKNLELRKQLKKLQKILSIKTKARQKLEVTHSQIEQLKQKLKSVLNASQSLEMSIVKIKGFNKSKQKIQNTNEDKCCCSRYKKYKQISKNSIKIQKQNFIEKQQQNSLNESYKPDQKYLTSKRQKTKTCQRQIQCELNYLQDKKENIRLKKEHIQKLKKLIESQSKVMKQYEQKAIVNTNVGKITKAINIKSNAYIKTCASVGSITKTSRYKVLK